MHSETMVHIWQTLGYKRPFIQNTQPQPPAIDLDFEFHDAAIPGGTYQFGATPDMGFVLDNEKWAHPFDIKPSHDTFDGYPGFVIDPYVTYSEPSFDQHKVLRWGCWVTRSRVIRNTCSNFYAPDRNNIFAGFRTCAI